MRRWEYCMISNPQSGTDAVIFSHGQPEGIVQEFSTALGKGLKAEYSRRDFLHLNFGHTHITRVAGLLGERGWEMVAHAALTGGHEYWTFKREIGAA
jgi:hypothetical protein